MHVTRLGPEAAGFEGIADLQEVGSAAASKTLSHVKRQGSEAGNRQ